MNVPVASAPASKEAGSILAHEGTYLGFSPTDESTIAMGEIKIVIARETVSVQMATGLEIKKFSIKPGEFQEMTTEEIAAEYNPGSDAVSLVVGFRTADGTPKFLFVKDKESKGPGLIVRTGGLGEILGPTVLFNPIQIARGDFNEAIANIEQQAGKGVLPRLRNRGKAERR